MMKWKMHYAIRNESANSFFCDDELKLRNEMNAILFMQVSSETIKEIIQKIAFQFVFHTFFKKKPFEQKISQTVWK